MIKLIINVTIALILAVVCTILYYTIILWNLSSTNQPIAVKLQPPGVVESDNAVSPWQDVPRYVLYLRLTSGPRWETEYRKVLIRTMKIFYPIEGLKLLVVLDDEKPEDHSLGERLKSEWPYPDVCYRGPGDPEVYHNYGKGRMLWDMMHPDNCTNATYVGYIDTDTFFSTLVTPDLLFENRKPVIVAKIGQPAFPCWVKVTELVLRRKEVMQCMSVFPLMIKTSHMKELRMKIAKEHGKTFGSIFSESAKEAGGMYCLCQFSLMCNYVWYYHRDEYSWHLQMVPDGNWTGASRASWVPNMVKPEYFHKEVKPEEKIPIPRSAIHLRYSITNKKHLLGQEPEPFIVDDFIREGLCYSGGFERCPEKCKRWNKNKVHYNLYSFEWYQWFWDKRCLAEQEKHYEKVESFLQYYVDKNKEIFGLQSISQMCSLFDNI